MQIKKDILLFLVLALLFTGLLLNARSTEQQRIGSCLQTTPAGKCTQSKPVERGGSSPLNFITRGIFHLPS